MNTIYTNALKTLQSSSTFKLHESLGKTSQALEDTVEQGASVFLKGFAQLAIEGIQDAIHGLRRGLAVIHELGHFVGSGVSFKDSHRLLLR
jgi:hypothetical protein